MNPAVAIPLLALASVAAAVWLTGLARAYALRAQLIDQVNARGAHSVATPRGGGISIVVVASLGFLASLWLGFPPGQAVGLIGGGLAIAAIGWRDDHGHVSPLLRLAVHFTGAIWAVAWIGPLPLGFVPYWDSSWVWAEAVLTVFAIVWMINLYNFMDGIDGLAGSEAVSVCLAGSILLAVAGAGVGSLAPPILLAAACLGFLRWNWPPARIFMGDASSGFLGFSLAVLAVIAGRHAPALGVAWFVLPGVFIVDASVTLGRRLLRREKVHQAHRSHAYQILARRFGRHLPVTLGAVAVTWLWLFPVAYLIATLGIEPILGTSVAFVPLIIAALAIGAGRGD